jgi:hypothetical protein
MPARLGMHPDTPNCPRNVNEAMTFSRDQMVCPHCQRKGGHEYEAHASLYRKTRARGIEFFDAHCVRCGGCQTLIPVFHRAYDDGWSKEMVKLMEPQDLGETFVDERLHLFSGSGMNPQAWLPGSLMASAAESHEDTPENVLGLIVCFDPDDQPQPGMQKGCGHTQYVMLGPSVADVMRAIPRTPILNETIHQRGRCIVCGEELRGVVIVVDGRIGHMELRALVHGFPCPVVHASDDRLASLRKNFGSRGVELARQGVVFMPSTGGAIDSAGY